MFAIHKKFMMKSFLRTAIAVVAMFQTSFIFSQVVAPKETSVKIEPKKKIPTEAFFTNSKRTEFSLSPDGNQLAYLAPFKDVMNLFVEPINGGEPKQLSFNGELDIIDFRWGDDQNIFFISKTTGENFSTVFRASMQDSEVYQISEEGLDCKLPSLAPTNAGGFYFMQRSREKNGYDLCIYDTVRRANMITFHDFGCISDYYVSFDGGRVLAMELSNGTKKFIAIESNQSVRKIVTMGHDVIFEPVSYSTEEKFCIVVKSSLNKSNVALVLFDFVKGEEKSVLFKKEKCNVDLVETNKVQSTVLALHYSGASKGTHVLRKEYEPILKVVSEKLSGSPFVLHDSSNDGNVFIVMTGDKRSPATYYRYNHANKELKLLDRNLANLTTPYMCDVKTTSFMNRRGKEVQVTQVLPNTGSKGAPAIIYLPEWPEKNLKVDFDPEVQFLANRGFVVLVIDYLGSSEYGSLINSRGYSEWGQMLQDDVVDAAKFLIKSGTAHPDKLALLGKSFGGFVASSVLTTERDVIRSVVAINGIFNLNYFLESGNKQLTQEPQHWGAMLGNGQSDKDMINKHSLVEHCSGLKNPICFVYSASDEVISPEQTTNASVTMAQNGVMSETIYIDDFHDISKKQNQVIMWDGIIDFLNRAMVSTRRVEDTPARESERRR